MASNGNWDWENGNLSFLDLIAILSFVIGIENLRLNQQQVDNLEAHLTNQDNELFAKVISQLSLVTHKLTETEKQNELLIKQNEKLLDLLMKK